MKPKIVTVRVASALALLLLTGACGGGGGAGGGGGDGPPEAAAEVNQIAVGAVRFGQATEFVVTGTRLDSVTHAFTGQCTPSPATDSALGSVELRLHCTPDDLGVMSLSIYPKGGLTRLASKDVTIDKPQVKFSVGAPGNTHDITVTLEPGAKASVQRDWVNNFLYYVNSGYYAGKIFHRVNKDILIEGGCYADNLKPVAATPAPVTPSVPATLLAPNDRYSLAMVPTTCGPGYTAFALNLADNSIGKIQNQDQERYIVIGRYDANDAAVASSLSALPNTRSDFLENPLPDDRSLATIRGALQTR